MKKKALLPGILSAVLFLTTCSKDNVVKIETFTSDYFKVEKLADGVYAVIAGEIAASNSGIIDMGDKTIIFDTFKDAKAAEDLKKAAENWTGRDKFTIINSHSHSDHIGGNQVFSEDNIIVSENVKMFILRGKGKIETFTGGKKIEGKKKTILLKEYVGAHSGSDTVMYIPEDKILFMADLKYVLGYGDPMLLDNILGEYEDIELNAVVWGHGPLGTKDDIKLIRGYINWACETVKNTIDTKGTLKDALKNPIPEAYASWDKEIAEMNEKCITNLYNKLLKQY